MCETLCFQETSEVHAALISAVKHVIPSLSGLLPNSRFSCRVTFCRGRFDV